LRLAFSDNWPLRQNNAHLKLTVDTMKDIFDSIYDLSMELVR
jgi:hypothetical protein